MAAITGAITLMEAARAGGLTALDEALVETFMLNQTGNGPKTFYDVLPFVDMPGASGVEFTRELTLPTITPRRYNETITRSAGASEKVSESFKIYDSEYVLDAALLRTEGGLRTLARQASMHAKAILEKFMLDFFKGDETTTPAQITGLQARCTGAQLVDEGSTAGGDPLQLATLDNLIDQVNGPNKVLLMCKGLKRRVDAAQRTSGVAGNIWYDRDEFGGTATMYKDVPIIPVADFNGDDNILAFDEAGSGGGSTATSVYCVSMSDEGVVGLRNGFLDPRNLGESPTEPAQVNRLMLFGGIKLAKVKGAARLRGVSDAAVIA